MQLYFSMVVGASLQKVSGLQRHDCWHSLSENTLDQRSAILTAELLSCRALVRLEWLGWHRRILIFPPL